MVAGMAPAPLNWNDQTGGLIEKIAVSKKVTVSKPMPDG